jgi:Family of unknown function (DUF5675)
MNLTLRRTSFTEDGIFGLLIDDQGEIIAVTLERAYPNGALFEPKVVAGEYVCNRGTHKLLHGGPFETFELQNVPGHTGVLLHKGNVENDSEGCILLGSTIGAIAGQPAILNSKGAFDRFMGLQVSVNTFNLKVC